MFIVLCIFLIISFFELKHLLKIKEKKEAFIYIGLTAAAVLLALFLLLTPDYTSFAKIVLDLFNIR